MYVTITASQACPTRPTAQYNFCVFFETSKSRKIKEGKRVRTKESCARLPCTSMLCVRRNSCQTATQCVGVTAVTNLQSLFSELTAVWTYVGFYYGSSNCIQVVSSELLPTAWKHVE